MAEMNAGGLLVIRSAYASARRSCERETHSISGLQQGQPRRRQQQHRNASRVGEPCSEKNGTAPAALDARRKSARTSDHVAHERRPDVLVHVMRELVRENHFDLIV